MEVRNFSHRLCSAEERECPEFWLVSAKGVWGETVSKEVEVVNEASEEETVGVKGVKLEECGSWLLFATD